jgi:hypothetical protein
VRQRGADHAVWVDPEGAADACAGVAAFAGCGVAVEDSASTLETARIAGGARGMRPPVVLRAIVRRRTAGSSASGEGGKDGSPTRSLLAVSVSGALPLPLLVEVKVEGVGRATVADVEVNDTGGAGAGGSCSRARGRVGETSFSGLDHEPREEVSSRATRLSAGAAGGGVALRDGIIGTGRDHEPGLLSSTNASDARDGPACCGVTSREPGREPLFFPLLLSFSALRARLVVA